MAIEVDPDWWKSLFDEVYLLTDARSVCNEEITSREVDLFCELLPLRTADRILDLCGGQGRHSLELCRRGYTRGTVLDYSAFLIERGREWAAESGYPLDFVQGDAVNTGFPEGSFDHVLILGNSLGYLPDRKDDRKIMTEALRLLRPGGWLLLDAVDGAEVREKFNANAWHEIGEDVVVCRQREREGDLIRAREVVLSKARGIIRDRTYAIRTYLPEELVDMAEGVGFEDVRAHRRLPAHKGMEDRGFMDHRVLVRARKIRSRKG